MKNSMLGGQSQGGPKIDISATTPVKCENCECEYFVEVLMMRKASRLLTGGSKDSIIPIPTMRCADCGHVNDDFKIKEL
jgi:uncharacterized Zn finger protein